jgi:hypothetical protein
MPNARPFVTRSAVSQRTTWPSRCCTPLRGHAAGAKRPLPQPMSAACTSAQASWMPAAPEGRDANDMTAHTTVAVVASPLRAPHRHRWQRTRHVPVPVDRLLGLGRRADGHLHGVRVRTQGPLVPWPAWCRDAADASLDRTQYPQGPQVPSQVWLAWRHDDRGDTRRSRSEVIE